MHTRSKLLRLVDDLRGLDVLSCPTKIAGRFLALAVARKLRVAVGGSRSGTPATVCSVRLAVNPVRESKLRNSVTGNLQRIFSPEVVCVIGASQRTPSVGNTVLKNLIGSRSGGKSLGRLFAVNPKYEQVEGVECFDSVVQLPQRVDLAIICTPAVTVPGIIRQCGEAAVGGAVILSAGFREVGQEGLMLENELARAASAYPELRIIGPNCLGVMSPWHSLNASFGRASPQPGHVAFLSQSGALCTAVLDWAIDEDVGFSHFVSMGNMLDVGVADLIDFLDADPHTDAIVMCVESITDARRFMSAARAFTRTKPIIAYKAGRFEESARAAALHTGAMAGVDDVYDAAFARAGIVRVDEFDDLLDCAELLARQKLPRGQRLAIVTNAGGPGVMAADALLQRNGTLAALSVETQQRLDDCLPAAWSRSNPVDILGDATPKRFADAAQIVINDRCVDAIVVVLAPQAMTDPTGIAEALIQIAKETRKPILTAWMGGSRVRAEIEKLNQAGIPAYRSPKKAIAAFQYLVQYASRREALYETPYSLPIEFAYDRESLRERFQQYFTDESNVLSEVDSKALLEAYGIPVSQPIVAETPGVAARIAAEIGFPVAVKIHSPDVTHKSDVGGVLLNVVDADAAYAAFETLTRRCRDAMPEARIEGVTIQRMVVDPAGRELIVGAKRDPVFGTVLMVGAGGTNAELLHDRALELPPLNERLARRMLESLRLWPLLGSYRGNPAVDLDRLIEILIRISYLVADFPEIIELDVNPLLVTAEDAIALDARMVVIASLDNTPATAYSHLAIRPYPAELIKPATLKDGTKVRLRPIRGEDEPLWRAMIESCSVTTIRLRFGYLFGGASHELASRFCFNDYDRELAMVAEVTHGATSILIGVGRLVADAEHTEAEFAVLVVDAWQRRGLGGMLADECLAICRSWGIHRVVAEVAPQNRPMLKMFEQRGFRFDRTLAADVVRVVKDLP